MLHEFVAIPGCYIKHAARLLNQCGQKTPKRFLPRGRSIYGEVVRQALIVVWEASDRFCDKRPRAALPSIVESLHRHGHLASTRMCESAYSR